MHNTNMLIGHDLVPLIHEQSLALDEQLQRSENQSRMITDMFDMTRGQSRMIDYQSDLMEAQADTIRNQTGTIEHLYASVSEQTEAIRENTRVLLGMRDVCPYQYARGGGDQE